jgi:hypothetical protein
MSIKEVAELIRKTKPGLNYPGVHMGDDQSVVIQYTRHEMKGFVHITDQHILECCEKAVSYDEHIRLCTPLAIADTARFNEARRRPPGKGRTRQRFH